jgi:hypothetical protein
MNKLRLMKSVYETLRSFQILITSDLEMVKQVHRDLIIA